MKDGKKLLLLTAGPANISEGVRNSLLRPDISHRDEDFANLISGIRDKLVRASGGNSEDYTSVIFINSGTGAIESVVGSVVHDKKLLVIVNGDYGNRIRKIAQILHVPNCSLEYKINEVPDLNKVDEALRNEEIGYVGMVHMETTIGKINPMHDVGILARRYNKTFIVDAMASFATEPLNVEDDNIDFCIANSNKGIQGVPGLSFVVARKEALERIKDKKPRSLYFDLYGQYKMEEEKGQTLYTPAIQSLFGLDKALDELFKEGIESRIMRYENSSRTLIDGMERFGIRPYLPPERRARTLTTFVLPENIEYRILYEGLKEEGYEVYPSKGLSINAFRIGNLGIVTPEDIKEFLIAFENVYDKING